MIYGVYVIRDDLTGYLMPSFDHNDPSAVRNFSAAVNNQRAGNLLHTNPGDYTLYKIASYDTVSGVITPVDRVQLATGQSVMLKEDDDV